MHQLPPFFCVIFHPSLPRLGPGDDASTHRALDLLGPFLAGGPSSNQLRIIDIGCGNGAQTPALAKRLTGRILALDNHQPYLDELVRRAEQAGVADKITPICRDMAGLSSDDSPFDLVWSEGALFAIGFRQGLTMCRDLLRPGGCLAVSELCWLLPEPPKECRAFFETEYPAMTDIDGATALLRSCGLAPIGHFVQPESSWWDPYYRPLDARLCALMATHADDPEKRAMMAAVREEIAIYRRFSAYYGNVFFLARRE